MGNTALVVGLDVGQTKVAVIVAEIPGALPIDGRLRAEVIGVGVAPSLGLQRGSIVDMARAAEAVRHARQAAERAGQAEILCAFVGLAGDGIMSQNEAGVVPVADQSHISIADVERAMANARDVNLPEGREVCFACPRSFTIDGQRGISDPVGMSGLRLEVEAHVVTALSSYRRNLEKCIVMAGVQPSSFVLEPVAAAEAVTSEAERQMGVVLIDIGGGTTDISVFHQGTPYLTACVPVGGDLVTQDISIGLRTTVASSESLKTRLGTALPLSVPEGETIEFVGADGRGAQRQPRRFLARIVEARLEEIFDLSRRAVERAGGLANAPAGVVLTGGGSQLPGTQEVAQRVFGDVPVRLGRVESITGDTRRIHDPSLTTCLGLVLRGGRQMLDDTAASGPEPRRVGRWVRRLLGKR